MLVQPYCCFSAASQKFLLSVPIFCPSACIWYNLFPFSELNVFHYSFPSFSIILSNLLFHCFHAARTIHWLTCTQLRGKLKGWSRQDKRFAIKKSHSTHNCVLRESEKHRRTRMSFSASAKIYQTRFAPFICDVWFSFCYYSAWILFLRYIFLLHVEVNTCFC